MKKIAILDTETTSLDERTGDLWELGLILRQIDDDGEVRDWAYWWQVRPDLTNASPNSVLIGRYYERSRVTTVNMGMGKRLAPSIDKPKDDLAWTHHYSGKPPALGDYYRDETATWIAAQVASMLDGATIVANNPAFDRKFLEKFLSANGQILTASHRMIDIRTLMIGYIHGANDAAPLENTFRPRVVDLVREWLYGDTDNPSWEIVGVTQDPATAHTALGDARLVREVYDAICGGVA